MKYLTWLKAQVSKKLKRSIMLNQNYITLMSPKITRIYTEKYNRLIEHSVILKIGKNMTCHSEFAVQLGKRIKQEFSSTLSKKKASINKYWRLKPNKNLPLNLYSKYSKDSINVQYKILNTPNYYSVSDLWAAWLLLDYFGWAGIHYRRFFWIIRVTVCMKQKWWVQKQV